MGAQDPVIEATVFQETVEQRFGPLMTRFGFQRTEAVDHAVRYERAPVFVEVSHDARRSYETEVWIGTLDSDSIPLELVHALEGVGCPPQVIDSLGPMQSDDPDVVGRLIDRAVAALETCGEDLLREGSDAIERALDMREAQAEEDERTDVPRFVVEDAEAAWAEKDFHRLHDLLHPYRQALDPTLKRRLEFADKRMKG